MPSHNDIYSNDTSSTSSSSSDLKNVLLVPESLQLSSTFTDPKQEIQKLKEQYKKEEELISRSSSSSSLKSSAPSLKFNRYKDFFDDQETRSASLSTPHISSYPVRNNFSTARTTSYLKPGSTFVGSQQSGRSTYEVIVELKEVDLSKSELSGFLKIQGLTEDYPEITTFFKSEIVGNTHSFFTEKESWGSSPKNDLQHWSRFQCWRALNVDVNNDLKNKEIYDGALNQEYLYMRWKETFLVPDAKITTIRGASFAGFYYICFNQLTGSITGLYFHKSSERFQQLELSHVPDSGCFPLYHYQ